MASDSGESSTPYTLYTANNDVLSHNSTASSRAESIVSIPNGIVLGDKLHRLRKQSHTNLLMAIFSLIYIGVNIGNSIINSMDDEFRDQHELTFHLTEFWATFFFANLQAYAMVGCPRKLEDVFNRPLMVRTLMFLNVVINFVPAFLVTVSLEDFEVYAHELEYANEITMAILDFLFLYILANRKLTDHSENSWKLVATCVALGVAVVQLVIYNGLGGTHGGPGEQIAHFFEFVFEGISGFITFNFCMNCKFECDQSLHQSCCCSQSSSTTAQREGDRTAPRDVQAPCLEVSRRV